MAEQPGNTDTRVADLIDEAGDSILTTEFVRSFRCPKCHARSGVRCVTNKGIKLSTEHVGRRKAALASIQKLDAEVPAPAGKTVHVTVKTNRQHRLETARTGLGLAYYLLGKEKFLERLAVLMVDEDFDKKIIGPHDAPQWPTQTVGEYARDLTVNG